jgi:hypothetical protein
MVGHVYCAKTVEWPRGFFNGTTKLEDQILNILTWTEWKSDQAIQKKQDGIDKELYVQKKRNPSDSWI